MLEFRVLGGVMAGAVSLLGCRVGPDPVTLDGARGGHRSTERVDRRTNPVRSEMNTWQAAIRVGPDGLPVGAAPDAGPSAASAPDPANPDPGPTPTKQPLPPTEPRQHARDGGPLSAPTDASTDDCEGACAPGQACLEPHSCASNVCTAGTCRAACSGACQLGEECQESDDCQAGTCMDGVCRAACPGGCAPGHACAVDDDCRAGACLDGQCRGTCRDDERCYGRDGDCDGLIDERTQNRCRACGAEPAEVCDGRDNDCDARIDELAVCPPDEACESDACTRGCGDGRVSRTEPCEAGVDGWTERTCSRCERTFYKRCDVDMPEQCQVGCSNLWGCSDECEGARDCPGIPGFQGTCVWGICALACSPLLRTCPAGQSCVVTDDERISVCSWQQPI